jgi:hypothetical protein
MRRDAAESSIAARTQAQIQFVWMFASLMTRS